MAWRQCLAWRWLPPRPPPSQATGRPTPLPRPHSPRHPHRVLTHSESVWPWASQFTPLNLSFSTAEPQFPHSFMQGAKTYYMRLSRNNVAARGPQERASFTHSTQTWLSHCAPGPCRVRCAADVKQTFVNEMEMNVWNLISLKLQFQIERLGRPLEVMNFEVGPEAGEKGCCVSFGGKGILTEGNL